MIKLVTLLLKFIERFNDSIGRLVSWLTVTMVGTVLIIVVARYFLQMGSIALQESVTYLHAAIFLLGIAYTLKHDGHVRVDIFYRQFSARSQAVINLLGGTLFLMPTCILILVASWDYVLASWTIWETSAENNGLPFVYLLKSLILLMPVTLFSQGIAEILKSLLILNGQFSTGKRSHLSNAPDNPPSIP